MEQSALPAMPEAIDLDAVVADLVPHTAGPPCRIEGEFGISDHDRAIADVGHCARLAGNNAAVTDPAEVAAIRRRIAAQTRPGCLSRAWRRALRRMGR